MKAALSYTAIGMSVLLAAAAGTGDFELVTPLPERICAKSAETCEAARSAVAKGWFLPELPRDAVTVCRPVINGCFSETSNCIAKFNCGDR